MSVPLRVWIVVVSAVVGLTTGVVIWFISNFWHVFPDGLQTAIVVGGLIGLVVGLAVIGLGGYQIVIRRASND